MQLSSEAVVILLVTLVVVVATLLYQRRSLLGASPNRRRLPALDRLRAALGRGAETGKAIHVSPGVGTIGSGTGSRATTAETLAGLLVADRVTSEAALNGAPILVSSGDAVTHLALRGVVRQAYQQAGQSQDYDPARIQLLSHQNELAYAAGVAALYGREQLEASMLVGSFGQEFLLIGEDGAQRGLPQVFGTTNTVALPLMMLASEATLIGEEIFAAEAYLTPDAPAQARLQTVDLLRTTVLLLIIGGIIYSLLQPQLGLPALPSN
jgi:hypothetical protein